MKIHRQRGFVKLECAIVDRFEDDRVFLLFIKLLCLMDRDGFIRMDYDAIAARVRWCSDDVIEAMTILKRPDPASRCQRYQGACVVPIDRDRPHLGFFIPAAARHRKANVLHQVRREYKARKLREYRAALRTKGLSSRKRQLKVRGQREDMRGQREDKLGLPLPGENGVRRQCEDNVKTNEDCDREGDRENKILSPKPSLTVNFTGWTEELKEAFFLIHGPGRLPTEEELVYLPGDVRESIVQEALRLREKKNGGAPA